MLVNQDRFFTPLFDKDGLPGGPEDKDKDKTVDTPPVKTPEELQEEKYKELEAQIFMLKKNQSDTDKVRKEYSDKLKVKESELANLQKEHMTEKEQQEFKQAQEKEELQKERDQNRKDRLEIHAQRKLNEVGLPLDFAEMVIGADEAITDQNVQIVNDYIQACVKKTVEEKFKEFGFKPDGGGGRPPSSPEKNPWLSDHFNLTEQGRLLKEEPELAKKFQAEAKLIKKG